MRTSNNIADSRCLNNEHRTYLVETLPQNPRKFEPPHVGCYERDFFSRWFGAADMLEDEPQRDVLRVRFESGVRCVVFTLVRTRG